MYYTYRTHIRPHTLIKLLTISIFALLTITTATLCYGQTNLEEIITASHRSEAHIARNQYRHPLETLRFFQVEENMTVVEIWPGAKGWYTEILAPYLKDEGKLYAAHFSADSKVKYFTNSLAAFKNKLANNPDIYSKVLITTLNAPTEIDIAPKNSADRVLTFRNVHNWLKQEGNGIHVFKAMYDTLKPGGILGVVEHRAAEGTTLEQMQKSGYVSESYTIALAKKAGFELLEKSEINANPKDNKDHPKGVWTLPPSLRLGKENKDHYLSIGESDRMTLKFIKPANN